MSSSEMKISSTFSEPTMNIMPTVASISSAKYSPTCSVNVESMESQAAKTVSSSTACLTSCVKGSMTSIPCQDSAVVCCCTWNRSEEHTSELQSHHDLVCRLLLEKKNIILTA